MVIRVKTLGRPKDRAASQIPRKPSSSDVRKPAISECQKKKKTHLFPGERGKGLFLPLSFPSIRSLHPQTQSSSCRGCLFAKRGFERHLVSSWFNIFD